MKLLITLALDRLRVVGCVQDVQGALVAMAQSKCQVGPAD